MAPTRVRKTFPQKKKPVTGGVVPVEQINQSDKLPAPDGQDQVPSTGSKDTPDNGNLRATLNLYKFLLRTRGPITLLTLHQAIQADHDAKQSTDGDDGEQADSQNKSKSLPKRPIVIGDDTMLTNSHNEKACKRQRRDTEDSSKENKSPSRDSLIIKIDDSDDEAKPCNFKREKLNFTQSGMSEAGHTIDSPIMIEDDPPMDKDAVLAIVKTLTKDTLLALMEDMRQEIPLMEDEPTRQDSPLGQDENDPQDSHPTQDENARQDSHPRRSKANKAFKRYLASDNVWMNQQLRDLRKGQAIVKDFKDLVRKFEKDCSSLIYKEDIWINRTIAHIQRCGAQDQKMTEQLEKVK